MSRKPRGPIRWLRAHIVQLAAAGALIYMFLPIVVVVVFSFNDPAGRFNYEWNEFSTEAWTNLCGVAGHVRRRCRCRSRSRFSRPSIATVLGTLSPSPWAATGSAAAPATNLLIFMPMATPEVVMGASLLTLFVEPG